MKFTISKGFISVLVLGLVAVLASCSDMDEYQKYVEEGEITYTGKIDSLNIYSGENRVLVEGLFMSDPKITETRIYWDNKKDSVVIPVERSNGVDTLHTYIENLEEKAYNFEIVTYDGQGNASIPVYANASVYGERYQASLLNRPIKRNSLYAGNLTTTLEFGGMDLTSGVFATEVKYMDSDGQEHSKIIPVEDSKLKLENYKVGEEFQYRTLFLPEPTSIDTFYTDYKSAVPEVVYLKNYKVPFKAEERSGRWGILADWTTNDAARNHDGYGGWDEWNGNIFNVESGWGAPGITNGKIYQTVTLAPGTYTFKANLMQDGDVNDTWNVGEGDYAYIVVAEGTTLPDVNDGAIENDPATIGYSRVLREKDPSLFAIEFTVTEQKKVSVGYATTQPGGWVGGQYPGTANGRHCNITSFEFYKH